jgi:hypothetical protein
MTTSMVSFTDADGDVIACVYQAGAFGDPGDDLSHFLNLVSEAARDEGSIPQLTGFHDPGLLAARYVAWLTNGQLTSGTASIAPRGARDWDREYHVVCHPVPSWSPPPVREGDLA